jgi:hypothetical protein
MVWDSVRGSAHVGDVVQRDARMLASVFFQDKAREF